MRQDRHIALDHQVEKEIFQLRRSRMVRWFDQHVARIGDREQLTGTKSRHESRGHVDIGATDKL